MICWRVFTGEMIQFDECVLKRVLEKYCISPMINEGARLDLWGQFFGFLIGFMSDVPGSKLPLFPYNRGW